VDRDAELERYKRPQENNQALRRDIVELRASVEQMQAHLISIDDTRRHGPVVRPRTAKPKRAKSPTASPIAAILIEDFQPRAGR